MKWLGWLRLVLGLLLKWAEANTAARVRRAMSAEAKLHRALAKQQKIADRQAALVVKHGRKTVEHSEAGAKAKLRVMELEKELGIWEPNSPPPV